MNTRHILVACWLTLALFAGVGAWYTREFVLVVVSALFLITAILMARMKVGGE